MLFAIHCTDRKGLDIRTRMMPDHRTYLQGFADHIVSAGPLMDEDGGMVGSLLIMEFPDRAAVDAFIGNEPFAQLGLYETVFIHGYRNTWERPR